MSPRSRSVVLLGLGVLLSAGPLAAEVILRSVRWQASRRQGRRSVYESVDRWVQPPAARLAAKPRALVTLLNRGPKTAEGVLLRYAVSARLTRIGGGAQDGVWTVPFWHEERRVPFVKASQTKDIPIDNLGLEPFLSRMLRAGYWPDAIRLQLMVEPRAGEDFAERILEITLPAADK